MPSVKVQKERHTFLRLWCNIKQQETPRKSTAEKLCNIDQDKNGRLMLPASVSRGVLPYKGLMGTCGQPGYVFRDFCLKQGIDFIIFCLNQGIDVINCSLKQGIFSWTINSLRVVLRTKLQQIFFLVSG